MAKKQKKLIRKINKSLNYERLLEVCRVADDDMFDWLAQQPEVAQEKDVYVGSFNGRATYIYVKRGANILGVAHVDTVLDFKWADMITFPDGAKIIYSPSLDDRVGVWLLLELSHFMQFDMVFTTDEEQGASTITDWQENNSEKKYNWAFQFDRGYDDIALYDFYYNREFREDVSMTTGSGVDFGSYTCVSSLNKFCGMNIGKVFEGAHTKDCRVKSTWIENAVLKFVKFYMKKRDEKYEYKYEPYDLRYGYGLARNTIAYGRCKYCGKYLSIHREGEYQAGICRDCYNKDKHVGYCDICGKELKTSQEYYYGVCDRCDNVEEGNCKECKATLTFDEIDAGLGLCETCANAHGKAIYCVECGQVLTEEDEQELWMCFDCLNEIKEAKDETDQGD